MQTKHLEGVGRIYTTPKGDFPSVTTVLGAYNDKSFLEEWRKRVGDEEADRITRESSDIGNFLHYYFECYLANETPKIPENAEAKTALRMFKTSKRKLNGIVEKPLYIEEPVYSTKLRVAGRFDLLCLTKEGKVALLDYKNSRRDKTKEQIDSYRQQLAFYRIMIKETLGIEVQEMIIFMVLREGFAKVFRFYPEDTPFSELVEIRKNFYQKYGF